MEELVHDGLGHGLDALATLLVELGAQVREGSIGLDPGDLLGAAPELRQHRQRGAGLALLREGHDLGLDDGLGPQGFLGAGRVGLDDHLLQIVDVVGVDVVLLAAGGIDVARHRQVDEADGAAAPGLHHVSRQLLGDHVGRRARGDDDHVGERQQARQPIPRLGGGPDLPGERPRLLRRSVGHEDPVRPQIAQRLGRQRAHLAGAHQQHGAIPQVSEDLLDQFHRDLGDAAGAPGDLGLAADPLGGGEGPVAEARHERSRALRGGGQAVGLLHLAEDLGLADDHGVEAGRHAEEVTDRVPARVRVEVPFGVGGPLQEEAARLLERLPVHVALDPVAGGDHHGLAHAGPPGQAGHGVLELVAAERDLLAHRHRGALVREPHQVEFPAWAHLSSPLKSPPCRVIPSGSTLSVTMEATTSPNAPTVRSAKRRPCHPVWRSWTMAP